MEAQNHWSEWVLAYYRNIGDDWPKSENVELLLPYEHQEARRVREAFYEKYYDDARPRQLWLGINPGRFGAGVTGIPFSDPYQLEQHCGIQNSWEKKKELSAAFVFEVVNACGGPETFYSRVVVDSVSPIGFVSGGVNFNYYDDANYLEKIRPALERHLDILAQRPVNGKVVLIGKGKNLKTFQKLEHSFDEVIALPHPRWVMQYRRKEKSQWIDRYREVWASNGDGG